MNCVKYNEKTRVFSLSTKNSMYQMQVGDYDTLLHLYYGANVGETEITYRIIPMDRGFSGNPYEAGNDRTFSLDVLPQEYSGYGNGDYRINGMEAEHEDGSDVVRLCYESYEIRSGKYHLNGMPAMFGTDDEAQTLDIVLCDRVQNLKVHLLYGVFPNLDVITRAVRFENKGEQTVTLQRAMSMELDYLNRHMDFIHFYGRHGMERQTERLPLHHGVQSLESMRGTSSHQHNPFVILCDRSASEVIGDCFGFALVYSGNFLCEIELDQLDQTRLVMGIHPYHFSYRLEKGEVFETPEVIMGYSGEGLGKLSNIFHDAYRSNLIRSKYVNQPRPILINNWEATYFHFDGDKLLSIAEAAKDIGLDLFVLDDGWFGKRDDDNSGLGDWVVNEEKLKTNLPDLVKKINHLGMKFGLWIEPEMISEDSDLFRMHPDWCMKIPGRDPVRGRFQLNLDITRKEVRDYVMKQIFDVMDKCHVEYIKWDMNRSLCNVYSMGLPPERQGEVFHRYVLGLYDMMERLVSRYPDLLFENCSGGGGRFDAGMLYYSPQIWCSDNTDAIDRLKIQYGTSFGYPVSTMGAHVSVCPNHQNGRITPLETRGVVASAGTFGFELNLADMTEEDKEYARVMICEYREQEHLIQSGDYYRLTDPFHNLDYVMWEIVDKDKTEVIVKGVMLKNECNPRIHLIYLRGLKPEGRYQDKETGQIYTGAALMKAGLPLPVQMGDYRAVKFYFTEV